MEILSQALPVCPGCITSRPAEALAITAAIHEETRTDFGLPKSPPQNPTGVRCPLCARACAIGEGEQGYCGLRTTRDGRLIHLGGTARRGRIQWYRDPLPTNCVADWVCSGSRQSGSHNLAVFYASCTLNCLFCQNWHYRHISPTSSESVAASELADAANSETYCVCFFGGDPASQMPHALAVAERLARRGVVICWETAGTSNEKLLDHAVRLSLDSGGCIKFDLKSHQENLHIALTGASNQRTLDNIARAASHIPKRKEPPLVVVSTLLVPGYVTSEEVGRIARFLAEIDPDIPYSLLGFAPQFFMSDLPRTSLGLAEEAEAAARAAGLHRIHVGNRHLLSC